MTTLQKFTAGIFVVILLCGLVVSGLLYKRVIDLESRETQVWASIYALDAADKANHLDIKAVADFVTAESTRAIPPDLKISVTVQ